MSPDQRVFRVGEPKAEAALTEGLLRAAVSIIPPPPHASLVCVEDVELGTGRPDLLFLALDMEMLVERSQHGPRLPNLGHARVLGAVCSGEPAPYTHGYVRRLARELVHLGWTNEGGESLHPASPVVESCVVEAKVSDWRKGIGQLARYRWCAHRAALLVPEKVAGRVPLAMLLHNRFGLLVVADDGVSVEERAPESPPSWMAQQWTAELATRAMESERLHVLVGPATSPATSPDRR